MHRIQLFHCHENSPCGGGKTLLVDGFLMAKQFQSSCPEGYEFLSTYPLEAQYFHDKSEPHFHYINKDVAFKHCPYRYYITVSLENNFR